jgi:uroporphyrinogen-III synthase
MISPVHPTPTLIWTRSRTDWDEDQQLFAGQSFSVLHLPCLSFRAVHREKQFAHLELILDKGGPQVMVFTSAWGVRFAWDNPYLRSQLPNATIYALGEGTARAIHSCGLSCRAPQVARGGRELGALLLKNLNGEEVVVVLGGVERAFDLRYFLAEHGFSALSVDLYHTVSGLDLSHGETEKLPSVRQLLASPGPLGICFASPTAVEGFFRSLSGELAHCAAELIVCALGETTGQRCRQYFARVIVSPKPTLQALVQQAALQLS